METTDTPTNPNLAKPGAGLPLPELWFARLIFKSHVRKSDPMSAKRLIEEELATVLNLIASRSNDELAKRVLIKRIKGLEDSSRYWSAFMTLHHLEIVNQLFGVTIRNLGKGQRPDFIADTATVKPDPDVDSTIVAKFEKSCHFIVNSAEQIDELRTAQTFAHPWFGELDAFQWFALGGFHMRLHRKQIEAIFNGF